MKYLDMLINTVENADTESLLMSRRDCHAPGVDSIVLRNENGKLFRAFIVWPHHTLWKNSDLETLSVGVHNHRYDLTLELICGHIRNIDCKHAYSIVGTMLTRHFFTSGVENGSPTITTLRPELIRIDTDFGLGYLEMGAEDLHTIWCEEGKAAAWYVTEGEQVRGTTELYTNSPIETEGLYRPFESREQVIAHVQGWAEHVN